MKILFYCPFKFNIGSKKINSLGGIESLNINLCRELAKDKFNIHLASICNKEIKIRLLTKYPGFRWIFGSFEINTLKSDCVQRIRVSAAYTDHFEQTI